MPEVKKDRSVDQEIVKKVKGYNKCQSNQSAPAEAPLNPWGHLDSLVQGSTLTIAGPYKRGNVCCSHGCTLEVVKVHCISLPLI